jgi:hypothetical protein
MKYHADQEGWYSITVIMQTAEFSGWPVFDFHRIKCFVKELLFCL